MAPFRDRRHAGQVLAERLASDVEFGPEERVVVFGLPRGGVPVAAEVARALGAPLDAFVVRKLGVPGHEELAMGAVATSGVVVVNERVVDALRISPEAIERAIATQRTELERRERAFRGDRAQPVVEGRTVVVVDDGLATGSTMRAAIAALRGLGPARIIVAVPAASRETCAELAADVDQVVCAVMPEPFRAVGQAYVDFTQTTDDEVRSLL